ncbi:MAG: tRNA pseudouridine(38-40) synthase TruA, partial [Candidatus Eremiobacteraeota bacterium]|nr:tRNA pseudouridine(38-40) synthase TruA [Candidatus Eremiobacteraeota bacterium]
MRAVVEYDGTDFAGFQLQPQVRTVALELERALAQLFDQRVRISAAGRTDSGVHATGQVISFETERQFPFERLAIALNSI